LPFARDKQDVLIMLISGRREPYPWFPTLTTSFFLPKGWAQAHI